MRLFALHGGSAPLATLWSPCPRRVDVVGNDGETFGTAIAFIVDRDNANYAGNLLLKDKVWRLAIGGHRPIICSAQSPACVNIIHDAEMERLGNLVAAIMFEGLGKAA